MAEGTREVELVAEEGKINVKKKKKKIKVEKDKDMENKEEREECKKNI